MKPLAILLSAFFFATSLFSQVTDIYGLVLQNRSNTVFPDNEIAMNEVDISVRRGFVTQNTRTAFNSFVLGQYGPIASDGTFHVIFDGTGSNAYRVGFHRELNLLDGVTTYDLVLMKQHIDGVSSLLSPFLRISADVMNDGDIDYQDLSELRLFILGEYSETTWPLNYARAWRFMPMGHLMIGDVWNMNPITEAFFGLGLNPSSNYPFDMPPIASPYTTLLGQFGYLRGPDELENYVNSSAYAIKMGDLNWTNSFALFEDESVSDRSAIATHFLSPALSLKKNDIFNSVLSFKEEVKLDGFQLGIAFDQQKFTIKSLKIGNVELPQESYRIKDGVLKVSYLQDRTTQNMGDQLLTIEWSANEPIELVENSDAFFKLSDEFESEFIVKKNLFYPASLFVETSKRVASEGNNENAWFWQLPSVVNISTLIGIQIPENKSLTVWSINGREAQVVNQSSNTGLNLTKSGYYIATFMDGKRTFSKKIIVID